MGYYAINIVSEKPVGNYTYVLHSFSYYPSSIDKDIIDDLWEYIRDDKLMAAKQKLVIHNCFIVMNGMPVTPKVTTTTRRVKPLVEAYCSMFKPSHKCMQMIFLTPRSRLITVSVTYRKEQRCAD